MLSEERFSRILAMLRERGFVRVEELASALNVSDMTIRRDLEKFQETGTLVRCHGGAMLAGVNQREISFEDKSGANAAEKRRIAAVCATLVSKGMSVFLDAGTTTYEVAQAIRSVSGLVIITNDIRIAYSLLNSAADLVLVGGTVQKTTGSAIGELACRRIEEMRFDISFLGAAAIDDCFDVMTPTPEKKGVKTRALANSAAGYIVADSSKFRRRALHRINNLTEYAGAVTDCEFTETERHSLADRGIRILPALPRPSATGEKSCRSASSSPMT